MPQADLMYSLYLTSTTAVLIVISYGIYYCYFNKRTNLKNNWKEYFVNLKIQNRYTTN